MDTAREYLDKVCGKLAEAGHEGLSVAIREACEPDLAAYDADAFDLAQAFYWSGSDWHSGQSSAGYALLCASEYSPGMCERGCPEESVAGLIYGNLCAMCADLM